MDTAEVNIPEPQSISSHANHLTIESLKTQLVDILDGLKDEFSLLDNNNLLRLTSQRVVERGSEQFAKNALELKDWHVALANTCIEEGQS